jgi:hypothetical protein
VSVWKVACILVARRLTSPAGEKNNTFSFEYSLIFIIFDKTKLFIFIGCLVIAAVYFLIALVVDFMARQKSIPCNHFISKFAAKLAFIKEQSKHVISQTSSN